MTLEQERWAEALLVESQQGAEAFAFVAERIGALALQGDVDGVERWKAIAERLARLSRDARH
jgi:hypothetical protein